jgi:nicotinamide-nucleotide adenylyltransferase
MKNASVFIGRFQPFHLGHLSVLQNCSTETIYIGVGSSQYHHTADNPFTYGERKSMISKALSDNIDLDFDIYPVPDIHDPPHWVKHVKRCLPPFTMVLTNNDFTQSLFEDEGYTVIRSGLQKRDQFKGEHIRYRMKHDMPWEHLVPPSVATFLQQIDAVKRLKDFS